MSSKPLTKSPTLIWSNDDGFCVVSFAELVESGLFETTRHVTLWSTLQVMIAKKSLQKFVHAYKYVLYYVAQILLTSPLSLSVPKARKQRKSFKSKEGSYKISLKEKKNFSFRINFIFFIYQEKTPSFSLLSGLGHETKYR